MYLGQRVRIIGGKEGTVTAIGLNDRVPSREDIEQGGANPVCIEVRHDNGEYTDVPATGAAVLIEPVRRESIFQAE